ncbi:Protein of unknown function (DUF2892) [Nonlabens xylanidelens]|uniref:Inner membrane protein YgaP-like transmembrane domain-containing protein n=1 Tax=Nonlabens xylanidelens TaxID=191564 RepID=A0A2S6IR63_9FLAO|nr:DUF2892 domain-containing protein [Nonlabens xylanidelens]PPK96661.1 Protein of unknown function (DUF2892) [Nonlabens xylanidelens]
MKKNLGTIDRIIRILFAVVVSILFFTNVVTGTLGVILLIVGGVLLATSFMNFCPLYAVLGINSCPIKK